MSTQEMTRALVTGGCGFIGSALVRHLMLDCDAAVGNLDALTYAATAGAVMTRMRSRFSRA